MLQVSNFLLDYLKPELRAASLARLWCLVYTEKVAGSNPARPTIFLDSYTIDRQVITDRYKLRE